MEVGDDTNNDPSFHLVLFPRRKKLFCRVTLRNNQTCQGFHELLVWDPAIQPFVRSFILIEDVDSSSSKNPEGMNGTSLLFDFRSVV